MKDDTLMIPVDDKRTEHTLVMFGPFHVGRHCPLAWCVNLQKMLQIFKSASADIG